MKSRTCLYANEGKILTDGEIYGRIIYLAIDANADAFYEISDEEYAEILKAQEQEFDF